MSKSFEKQLKQHLEKTPRLNAQEKRLKRILALPVKNPRRKRVLERTEEAFVAKGWSPGNQFDPAAFAEILKMLFDFIKMIIDLFGGL